MDIVKKKKKQHSLSEDKLFLKDSKLMDCWYTVKNYQKNVLIDFFGINYHAYNSWKCTNSMTLITSLFQKGKLLKFGIY